MIKTLEIAEAIDRNKQSNPYDEYCKKVLSNKQILAWLIKGCVSEFKDIPLKDIPAYIVSDSKPRAYVDDDSDRFLGMNVEDHSVYGAVIIFDILVGLRLPNSSETENIDLVLNEEGLEKGREEGLTKGRVEMACELIINTMTTTNKTLDETMDFLKVDETLRLEISKLIKSKNYR